MSIMDGVRTMMARAGRKLFSGCQSQRCRLFVRNHYRKLCIDRELPAETRWGFRMLASPYDYASYGIYFFGDYDPRMSEMMRWHIREGQHVWDIGGERGWFTLLMAKCVGPGGRVDAFEAYPPNAKRLRANVQLNAMSQVHVHELAISDRAGALSFQPPEDAVTGGTSFLEGCSGVGHLTQSAGAGTIQVEAISLDEFAEREKISRLDFVKMDIEGAEVAALRGGKGVIERYRPILAVEYNRATLRRAGTSMEELDETIASYGYDRLAMRGTLRPVDLQMARDKSDEEAVFNVYCFPRRGGA